jgi:hypothetical protein
MAFEKGHKINLGRPAKKGPRGGPKSTGRMMDWLLVEIDKILTKPALFAFLEAVATGRPIDVEDKKGKVKTKLPSVNDRMRAIEMLIDRRFGRPSQSHDVSGAISLEEIIAKANRPAGAAPSPANAHTNAHVNSHASATPAPAAGSNGASA